MFKWIRDKHADSPINRICFDDWRSHWAKAAWNLFVWVVFYVLAISLIYVVVAVALLAALLSASSQSETKRKNRKKSDDEPTRSDSVSGADGDYSHMDPWDRPDPDFNDDWSK